MIAWWYCTRAHRKWARWSSPEWPQALVALFLGSMVFLAGGGGGLLSLEGVRVMDSQKPFDCFFFYCMQYQGGFIAAINQNILQPQFVFIDLRL